MAADLAAILWAALALSTGLGGWAFAAYFGRLSATMDDTAKRLQDVAVMMAQHGARIDALEVRR